MIVGRYITIGFIFTPMNAASMMLLPPDKVRMGAGLINIMQQGIGGTVGQEATIAAYQDCFMVVAALCVVVMPLVLFLRRQSAE
jgi:hypothetical protein